MNEWAQLGAAVAIVFLFLQFLRWERKVQIEERAEFIEALQVVKNTLDQMFEFWRKKNGR